MTKESNQSSVQWNTNLEEFMAELQSVKGCNWWVVNPKLKYLNLRIDTRDNAFLILDNDNNVIPIEEVTKSIREWKIAYKYK